MVRETVVFNLLHFVVVFFFLLGSEVFLGC